MSKIDVMGMLEVKNCLLLIVPLQTPLRTIKRLWGLVIGWSTFVLEKPTRVAKKYKQLDIFDTLNEEYLTLLEDNRTTLINKSRKQGEYRDKSRGVNRFERKKYSKIANAVKAFNKIDMNDFYKKDILLVQVPVTGETDEYTVSIKVEGVVAEIAKNVKSNKNKFEYRTVIQALTKVFNTANIYVNCTCPDYLYNFKH